MNLADVSNTRASEFKYSDPLISLKLLSKRGELRAKVSDFVAQLVCQLLEGVESIG